MGMCVRACVYGIVRSTPHSVDRDLYMYSTVGGLLPCMLSLPPAVQYANTGREQNTVKMQELDDDI